MKILYFDCPTGISGDMFLASLIDLGVDLKMITGELEKLHVHGEADIRTTKEVRHSITGTSFRVGVKETHHHRTFTSIREMIEKSSLSPEVKDLSIEIFRIIADAEGKVHGIPPEKVHFHEVGAMDSIVDIVGAAVAIKSLGVDRVVSSPLPLGTGWADTMHGRIPIPAPATLEILKGAPLAQSDIPFELTTPTGAAIIKALAVEFGAMPAMSVEKIGYGAGKKDFRESANLVRAVLGSTVEGARPRPDSGLVILETNIDDMSPQVAGYLMERLLEAGALDVYFIPVQMKKNRPGVLLTALTDDKRKDELMDIIFRESTSIGVRYYPVERKCLERKIFEVSTEFGLVRVKASISGGRAVTAQPEFDDCRKIAVEKGVPLKAVMDAARSALNNRK